MGANVRDRQQLPNALRAVFRASVVTILLGIVGLGAPYVEASNGFLATCERLFKIAFRDSALMQERTSAFLPSIEAQQKEIWVTHLARTPEMEEGLTHSEAITLLKSLVGTDLVSRGQLLRNQTYRVPLPLNKSGGRAVVVKQNFSRTEMTEGKVYRTTNDVNGELLAFLLDRYLGTNLVPPVIRLDANTVVQLWIGSRPITEKSASRDPAYLVEVSHTHLLDTLVGNADRNGPDNLLVSASGKLVAIDFDLAFPLTFLPRDSAAHGLVVNGVIIEPKRKVGKSGPLPGVFSKGVVEKLRSLDRAKLLEIAEEAGLTLTEKQITGVLAGRAGVLGAIEDWSKLYPKLIELDLAAP